MRHANFEGRDPYFGRTGVRRGSAMVLLDRKLVSYYRLSIVTMLLTEAVWPHFAMQVHGGAVSTEILVPLGNGRAILFASSDSFSTRRTV